MNKKLLTALTFLCCFLPLSASAAKPISITFESDNTAADGTEYAVYAVACSNGTTLKLTAWEKRKKWCQGDALQEDCERKQIKAAKKACR